MRPAQRGLDKSSATRYYKDNGGECACAGKASTFTPGIRPKMPKSGPQLAWGTKTAPRHVSSLLVAPRPMYGAARLPVPARRPAVEAAATASPGQLEQLPGLGATHLAHLAAPGAASPGPQPGPPGTRCHTADTSRPLDTRADTGAAASCETCYLTNQQRSGIVWEVEEMPPQSEGGHNDQGREGHQT